MSSRRKAGPQYGSKYGVFLWRPDGLYSRREALAEYTTRAGAEREAGRRTDAGEGGEHGVVARELAYAFHRLNAGRRPSSGYGKALGGRIRAAAGTLSKHGRVLADLVSHGLLSARRVPLTVVEAEQLGRSLARAGHVRTAAQWSTFYGRLLGRG